MSTITSSSGLGFLVADGDRMAIGFPSSPYAANGDSSVCLISSYAPVQITVDSPVYVDHVWPGREACFKRTGRQEVTIEVRGYGLKLVSLADAVNLFRNANSLSVNELLAIAYQKMRSRRS
jgi:uncharacterized protein (DUF1684 family)